MVGMVGRIQRTISRSVPVTPATVEELQPRSRCWRRDSGIKAGSLEADGDDTEEAGQTIVLDLSRPFMHAFIIPNYKVCRESHLLSAQHFLHRHIKSVLLKCGCDWK